MALGILEETAEEGLERLAERCFAFFVQQLRKEHEQLNEVDFSGPKAAKSAEEKVCVTLRSSL